MFCVPKKKDGEDKANFVRFNLAPPDAPLVRAATLVFRAALEGRQVLMRAAAECFPAVFPLCVLFFFFF